MDRYDDEDEIHSPYFDGSSVFFEPLPTSIAINSGRISGNRTQELINTDAASCFQASKYSQKRSSKFIHQKIQNGLSGQLFDVSQVPALQYNGDFVNKRPGISDKPAANHSNIASRATGVSFDIETDDADDYEALLSSMAPSSPINSASGWKMTPEQRRRYRANTDEMHERQIRETMRGEPSESNDHTAYMNTLDATSRIKAKPSQHQSSSSFQINPPYKPRATSGSIEYLDFDVDFIKANMATTNIPSLSLNWKMSSQYCPLKFKGKDMLIPLAYSPYNIFIANSGPHTKQYILDWMAANRRPRIASTNKGVVFKSTFDLCASKLVELLLGMGIKMVIIALAGMKTPMYNIIEGVLPLITRQRDNCYDISHVFNTDGIVLFRNIRSYKTNCFKSTVFPMLFQLGRVGEENYGSITLRCSDSDARIPFIRIYQTLFHYVDTAIHSFNVSKHNRLIIIRSFFIFHNIFVIIKT